MKFNVCMLINTSGPKTMKLLFQRLYDGSDLTNNDYVYKIIKETIRSFTKNGLIGIVLLFLRTS